MRNFQKLLAVIALSGLCFAAPSDSGAKKKAKPVKKDAYADQIKDLKQAIEQQQAATAQLQEQLKQTQQELQQTRQDLSVAQAAANAANAKASTIDNTNVQVQKVQADLTDVRGALAKTDATTAKVAKSVGDLEHPNSIAFKGVRITPGGFFDWVGYYRQRATNSGPATTFNAIPLENATSGVGGLSEYAQSARGSRLTLRLDGDAGKLKLAGFVEGDFYGVGNANPNQTTAWPFRIRQAWGRVKTQNGWTITAGQVWNLITMNRRAAEPDTAWIPNTLDTNYVVGWNWGRQGEVRVAKTLDPAKKLTLAVAITDPSMLTNSTPLDVSVLGIAGLVTAGSGNNADGFATSCTTYPVSSGTTVTPTPYCTYAATFSTNVAPDIIAKLAYDDPKLGHWEIKGVQRFFRDRVTATSKNQYATGTGIGAGFIIPVVPKKVDVLFQGLYGKGISRYQDSGQYDFVVRQAKYSFVTDTTSANYGKFVKTTAGDDTLQAIKAASAIIGIETHPNPRFELDGWFGTEYYFQSLYYEPSLTTPTTWSRMGYGSVNGASNKSILEGTLQAWYDVYKGPAGILRYGAQYEYVTRTTWSIGGAKAPKGIDNDVYLGMRYVFP